ncbi:MAG: response regulator transcription factor [Burkholderiales bacterium]|nr:response regulator transcription factor [Burkholderiales bacterium]MDE1929854.1 response regulator transcription factor [Burkholderiales bacterium]MDE2160112.1 response regulator transcription factor [Burkholderiales bacterium]MDE2502970.1 response regulator transcription factor [Burkholderiales bacterium]
MKILLADDHALFRAGLRALLADIPGVEIVAEASDGAEAVRLAAATEPDLAFLDIAMPVLGGLAAVEQIKAARPQLRVVVLSMHLNSDYIARALGAGADGYMVKDSAPSELRVAVDAVMAGRNYLSPAAASLLIQQALPGIKEADPLRTLSPRQIEVLRLVAEGCSTKEIARKLELSPKTVDIHRAQLMQRLDIHDVAGLTRFAIKVGIVGTD